MIRTWHLLVIGVVAASGPAWAGGGQDAKTPPPAGVSSTAPRRAAPQQNETPKEPAPVVVKATLNRTAAWVGDPVLYSIEITCPSGTDILAADIGQDRLRLNGLEVSEARQERQTRPDGTIVYRAQFSLVSFASEGSKVGIEPQSVRYYIHTAGQPPETLVPADEVQLPAVAIAVRSTLPDGNLAWIRDSLAITTLPPGAGYLSVLGVAAIALALAPAVVGVLTLARRRIPKRTVRSRRAASQLHRQLLDEIRVLGPSTDPMVRREAFDKLNALIRDRLTDFNIPAQSLTADEAEHAIAGLGNGLPAIDIGDVLRDCERAVYGGPGELPAADAVSTALAHTEQLLAARTR